MRKVGAIIAGAALLALPLPSLSYGEMQGRQGNTEPGSTDIVGQQGATPSHYTVIPVRRGEIKDVEGSPLQDAHVVNPQGQPLGTLEKLLADENTGKIEYGVLSLDDGARLMPFPWSSFKVKKDSGQVVLNATKDQLKPAVGDAQDKSPDLKHYMKEIERMRGEGAKTNQQGLGITKQPAAGGSMGEEKAGGGGPAGPRALPEGQAPQLEGAGQK